MVHERFDASRWVPPWIRWEHEARYAFAARYVKGRAVVDCASGDGSGAAVYAAEGAAQVTGFDVSAEAVAAAQARHPGLRFHRADARELPLPARSADVFVSLETIEHLETGEDGARAFVKEVARVLRPDGLFVCSTPDRAVYDPGKPPGATPWNPFHVREYDRAELQALLARCFGRVELFGQNPRSALATRARALLGRAPGHAAVRCTQLAKVALAPFDGPAAHAVVALPPERPCEYLVAVCASPR